MSSTLSLDASKKIHALIGLFECEHHCYGPAIGFPDTWSLIDYESMGVQMQWFPAPTFAELCRILPRIGEKKDLSLISTDKEDKTIWSIATCLLTQYMQANTEPEAMAQVEKYLMELLK